MQVDVMTNKWFDETFSQMQSRDEPARQLDPLVIGALHCGRKYCNGILVLLMNDHKMPAAALVRILFELYVKLLWCLQAPDKTDASAKDNCYQRLRRWDYTRATEHRKMLRELSPATQSSGDTEGADEAIRKLDKYIERLKAEQLSKMPSVAELCRDLGAELYPKVYRYFSRAVHLDMGLIRDMVHVSGGELQCFSDPPNYYEKSKLLLCCISMGCDVNLVVRRHYGWSCDKMRQEHKALVKQLSKTQEDA